MKNKIIYSLLTVTLLTSIYNSPALAQAGHVGGGDSVVMLPDGSVVIADPFIVDQSRVIRMNPVFENYIKWAKEILNSYSGCKLSLNVNVLASSLDKFDNVHLVSTIPDDPICMMEGAVAGSMLGGLDHQMVGCTIKDQIYLKRDLFERLPLSDQASLIVHEKLHAFLSTHPNNIGIDPARIHLNIFAIAGGMKTALNRLFMQQNGDLTRITDKEQSEINGMIDGINAINIQCFKDITATWSNGGGLVNVAALTVNQNSLFSIEPSAFIGIGSIVYGDASVNVFGDVTIQNSIVSAKKVMIAQKAIINHSQIYAKAALRIGGESEINRSFIFANRNLSIGSGSKVSVSRTTNSCSKSCFAGDISFGKNSSIRGFVLSVDPVENFISDTRQNNHGAYIATDISVGENVLISQVQFPQSVTPVFQHPRIKLDKTVIEKSVNQVEFKTGLILDRSNDPFTGCLNRSSTTYLTNAISIIQSDHDLEAMFCTRTRR